MECPGRRDVSTVLVKGVMCMVSDRPAPRSADSPRPATRVRPRWEPVAWVLGVSAMLLIGAAVVIFSAGDDLFGSDPGTIDSYNREVLESCELPSDSELVQISIRPVTDESGRSYRSMWFVYASPLSAQEVAEFFGVAAQQSALVAPERACKFGQRPSALVLPASVAGRPTPPGSPPDNESVVSDDDLWADHAADVMSSREVPAGTQSLFRLRLAQSETKGVL